ncbi:MAG: type II secretion system major pseudopilin GspG [Hyphomonadaceae bacterium]|nr:type II secretion system major pseudopilin GspG [Hyphomonadaceae bacterium]
MRKPRTLKAYTLTEMLVVLVIVGLLAAIVGPRLFSRLDDAKVRSARLQMTSLQTAIDLFRIDTGRLPSPEEGLNVLVSAPAAEPNWLGPYIARAAIPPDPWGREYIYEAGAEGFRIVSYGADGREGGAGANTDVIMDIAAGGNATAATAAPEAAAAN